MAKVSKTGKKPSKISKNRQKYKKTGKNVEKPSKISRKFQNFRKTGIKPLKMS